MWADIAVIPTARVRAAVLRAFDPAAWTATVQVTGSLSAYLAGVPVAKHLNAQLLTAGATVGVVFFDDANPADAAVVFAYGAVPDPWITGGMIVDGAIATDDLSDGAVTSAKIADGTIVGADCSANVADGVATIDGSGHMKPPGRIYPGGQSARYITDTGSAIETHGQMNSDGGMQAPWFQSRSGPFMHYPNAYDDEPAMIAYAGNSGNDGWLEVLRLTKAGCLGVFQTNPTAYLHVYDGHIQDRFSKTTTGTDPVPVFAVKLGTSVLSAASGGALVTVAAGQHIAGIANYGGVDVWHVTLNNAGAFQAVALHQAGDSIITAAVDASKTATFRVGGHATQICKTHIAVTVIGASQDGNGNNLGITYGRL